MNWHALTEQERQLHAERWMAAGGDAQRFKSTTNRAEVPELPNGQRLLLPSDPDFPLGVHDRLEICGPWFVRGELPHGPTIAVVGSRAVSHEGVRVCKAMVREVAAAGVTVASGGAIGVDTVAHEAALAVGGRTVAFLPSALDRLTPTRNARLFDRIAQRGALISEYVPGVTARKHHFARRNQLIATFADLVLVVRAKATGGTMLTARAAQRYGTALCAVPGSPEDATADGCHELIREGATCVSRPEHVLELLARHQPPGVQLELPSMTDAAADLLRMLEDLPKSLDELCADTPAHRVFAALTELEVLGCAEQVAGRWRPCRPTLRRERE